ncbi:MAG: LamG domain-containing protein, partial [Bacteroidota bacterium]
MAVLWSGGGFAQNALNFDGVNDYVQTTFPGVTGSANRTFEAWVFVNPSAPSSNLAIMDYGRNLAGSRNTFSVAGNRGLVFISGGTNANISSPAGGVPVGQWVHVAFVLNNGTGFLYINGQLVGSGNLSSVNTPSGFENMTIGQRVMGGSILFNGSIDDVRVWNVARSAAQIDTFRTKEFCSPPTGLVAYYKINEGTAAGNNAGITTTMDEVAGNNGTLNSFALTGSTSNFVSGAVLSTSSASTQTLSICEGLSVTVGSNMYDSTGIYVDTLSAISTGCDSVVTTDLTITPADSTTQTLTLCSGASITVGTNTYTATGIYMDTLTAVATGCDSIVITDLTINLADSTSQTLNVCVGSSVSVGTNTYAVSGMYVDTLVSTLTGCDSVVATNLTVDSVDVSTSVSGNTIMATLSGATYTWLSCDNGNAVIPGQSGQSFSPAQNGNYAVIVDDGNCADTSACAFVLAVGIEVALANAIRIFPNPSKGMLNVEMEGVGQFSCSI